MFAALLRAIAAVVGDATRTLWSGSPTGGTFVLAAIVALLVASGSLSMPAVSSVLSIVLLGAALLVTYSLLVRRH